jgi:hypothetical protein
MKYWEIIADNLSKAGWSWGCVSAIDSNGGTIRFVIRKRSTPSAFHSSALWLRMWKRSTQISWFVTEREKFIAFAMRR